LAPSGRAKTGAVLDRVRNLLQARRGAGHPPGRRADLPEVRGNAPGHLVDVIEHPFAVRTETLAQVAVFEQQLDHRVLVRQPLQPPLARVVNLDPHAGERLAHLRRTVEVDLRAALKEAHLRGAAAELLLQFGSDLLVRGLDVTDLGAPATGIEVNSG